MRFLLLTSTGLLAVACVLMLAGCGTATTNKSASAPTASNAAGARTASGSADMSVHEAEDHSYGTELSAEDQELADLQGLCPVSGEELGGMGPPVKLIVKGEPVFICCKGCEKKVNADPDKYLAKVAELKKAKPEQ